MAKVKPLSSKRPDEVERIGFKYTNRLGTETIQGGDMDGGSGRAHDQRRGNRRADHLVARGRRHGRNRLRVDLHRHDERWPDAARDGHAHGDGLKAKSLAEFAAANRRHPGPVCSVCSLPAATRSEMEAARANDPGATTYAVIARWLGTLGHSQITMPRVRHHFNYHVKRAA